MSQVLALSSVAHDFARLSREAKAIHALPMRFDLCQINIVQLRTLVMEYSESIKNTMTSKVWDTEQATIARENFTALRPYHLAEIEAKIKAYEIVENLQAHSSKKEQEAYARLVEDDISLYATFFPRSERSRQLSQEWADKLSSIYSLPCKPNLIEI